MTNTQVAIIGAGPVALMTALDLAQRGVEVELFEAEQGTNTSPRACIYHHPIRREFARLGVDDDLCKDGLLTNEYVLASYATGDSVSFFVDAHPDFAEHPFDLHLGQDKLSLVLMKHLQRMPNAKIHFGARITGLTQDADKVDFTVETADGPQQHSARWLIAADGASSTVREKLLKMNFFGITWPERFIATNILIDRMPFEEQRGFLQVDDRYGAIIVRIDGTPLWRVTFMDRSDAPNDALVPVIDETFKKLLPEGAQYELKQFSPYRMHQRCVDQMRVGRVLLEGDAAHITNPTGGLGLTTGALDAFALAEILAAVENEGRDVGVLDAWSDDRRRMFIEIASPQATRNKDLVFHTSRGDQLEQRMAFMRSFVSTPEGRKIFSGLVPMMFTDTARILAA